MHALPGRSTRGPGSDAVGDVFQSSFIAVLHDTALVYFSDTLVYFIADCGGLVVQDSLGIHVVPRP